jgi:glyoxylase-like metal-dependent hydrolase (beta-lactamase superfamily II)
MRLPREKIIFVVDLLPVGRMPGRGMIDFYPLEAEESIKKVLAMDWDRLIPGHPDSDGRLGTKQDAQDQLTLLQRGFCRDEEARPRRQMLGCGREGVQTAKIRDLARL